MLEIYCSKMLVYAASQLLLATGSVWTWQYQLSSVTFFLSLLWDIQMIEVLGGHRTVLGILSMHPFGFWKLGKGCWRFFWCCFLLCLPKEELCIFQTDRISGSRSVCRLILQSADIRVKFLLRWSSAYRKLEQDISRLFQTSIYQF